MLRAYKSVKTGQYKVLDITSLSQLVLVDKNHTYGAANSISLCNLDPRAGVLELTLQNEEKRKCSLKQAVIGLSCKPFLTDDP